MMLPWVVKPRMSWAVLRLVVIDTVPAAEITREFEAGMTPEEVCAKTVRALRDVGADKVYLSNLGFKQVESQYRRIIEKV